MGPCLMVLGKTHHPSVSGKAENLESTWRLELVSGQLAKGYEVGESPVCREVWLCGTEQRAGFGDG